MQKVAGPLRRLLFQRECDIHDGVGRDSRERQPSDPLILVDGRIHGSRHIGILFLRRAVADDLTVRPQHPHPTHRESLMAARKRQRAFGERSDAIGIEHLHHLAHLIAPRAIMFHAKHPFVEQYHEGSPTHPRRIEREGRDRIGRRLGQPAPARLLPQR